MDPLFAEGLTLALYGMGTVFFFLTLLVLVTMTMSWTVLRFEPPIVAATPGTPDNQRIQAAISAAVHQYRQDHE